MSYLQLFRHILLASALLLVSALTTRAQQVTTDVPRTISYQGLLTSTDGTPFVDGQYQLTVTLYADEGGTRPVWHDTYTTSLAGGVFNLYLGGGSRPLPESDVLNTPLWIGTSIDGAMEMRPLSPLAASPYALNVPDKAITTGKVADGAITGEKLGVDYVSAVQINGETISTKGAVLNLIGTPDVPLTYDEATQSVTVGRAASVGQEESEKGASVQATNNDLWTMRGDGRNRTTGVLTLPVAGDWLGTSNAIDLEFRVQGQRVMLYQRTGAASIPNIIGGQSNTITNSTASIIAEGSGNSISAGDYSAIGGGLNSAITQSNYASVGGGQSNSINNASMSFIGAGIGNIIDNTTLSVIGGGTSNEITGSSSVSVVGGGDSNVVSDATRTVVGGGYKNWVYDAPYSTVGGGRDNTIYRTSNSTIGGGTDNWIDWYNIAKEHGTIGGGETNLVRDSDFGTVGGGRENGVVRADYGTIPGGDQLLVTDSYAQVAVGFFNSPRGTVATRPSGPVIAASNDPLFMVGNGNMPFTRSNAFEVSYNGHSVVYGELGPSPGPSAIEGATYADNIIYGWGEITGLGGINSGFGIGGVTHVPGTGVYVITLNLTDPLAVPVQIPFANLAVTATLNDNTCAFINVVRNAAPINTFTVNIRNASCNPIDLPFSFHVTGRR